MNRNEARELIEHLRNENESWLCATKKALMDGIFSIFERVRVEKKKDFILELIQNADDCNSSEISFDLMQAKIIIQNDGNPFRSDPDPARNDVFAICKLGRTTKEPGKIGFMGFGFRAVFEVSQRPEIYSGDFSFYFDGDMIVPHWIERIPQSIKTRLDKMKDKGSIFVLPGLNRQTRQDIENALKNISPTLLLYLQRLKRIRSGDEILQVSLGPFSNSFLVSRGDKEQQLWKRYYSNPLPIPRELREFLRKDRNLDKIGKEPKTDERISVTFETTQEGKIADKQEGGLYAFLPLADEKNTKLRFNIQADFSVDAGRRKLREPEGSWNQWILANVHKCIPFILEDYKTQRDLRSEFYRILPLHDPERPEYLKTVKEKIDEYIRKTDSILVKTRKSKKHSDGKRWVKPHYAVIADPEPQKLFDCKDLRHLFGTKKFYVANDEIYYGMIYVKEIVEDHLSFDEILRLLKDSQWIFNRKVEGRKNPEKWVAELIIYIATQLEKKLEGKQWWTWDYKYEKSRFIDKLSDVKFLLTEQRKLHKQGKLFLPSSEDIDIPKHLRKKYDLVDRRLLRYLESKKTRSEIEKKRREKGLNLLHDITPKLSPETIVKEVINPAFSGDNWKRHTDSMLTKYADFIRRHEECWEIANIKLKVQTREKKRDYKIPKELYLSSKYGNEFDLDKLYESYKDDVFVSLDYTHKLVRSKSERTKQLINSWKRFLVNIGVKEIPEILKKEKENFEKKEIEEEFVYTKDKVRDTYSTYGYPGYAKRDYDFDSGLKEVLSACVNDKVQGSFRRLKILIRILDRKWDYYSKYLEAQYGWHECNQSGRTYERLRPSSFAKFLRDANWVPTDKGKHLKPEAVALNELKGIVTTPIVDYKIRSEEFKKYLQSLGLQSKPTVNGAIALLKSRVEMKENKIHRFVEIFEYLAQHDEEGKKIREKLIDFPCIFAPHHKKKYWKISEVFWESEDSFLEWKIAIGQRYPALKDFFLNVLNVKEKPTLEDYVEFLRSYLWKKDTLTHKEKSSVRNVYHHLNYIVTTPELKKSEIWLDLKKGFKIWCEDDRWAEIGGEIYYNDNNDLHRLFKRHTEILFAYIPKNMEVRELFVELGIKSLSETYVEKCSISGEQLVEEKNPKYENEIRRIRKYVALFVRERSSRTFNRLNEEGAFSLLGKSKVKFVENLEVEGVVGNHRVPLGNRLSFYSWKDLGNSLYLKSSLKGDVASCFEHIGIALSNAFNRIEGLEFFIPYIVGKTENQIIQSMENYGIKVKRELEIAEPERAPEIPVPEPVRTPIDTERIETASEREETPPSFQPPPVPERPFEKEPPITTQPHERSPVAEPSIEETPPEEPSAKPSGAQPNIEPPPETETPPEEAPRKPMTTVTERQIRDSRMATWVKGTYSYHCQVCLSKERPEILTYYKSYAGREPNRRSIMEAHHIKEVARDQGHDHIGNYLSLCRHHHTLFHNLNMSLDNLKDSLSGATKKEIIWPNGETTGWKMVTLSSEFKEENQPVQIVFNLTHLEKLEEYIKYVS